MLEQEIMERLITNNYLLIKRLSPKKESEGGILLAEKSIKESRWGYVVDVGEGLADATGTVYSPDVEVGDLVYFMQHAPETLDYTPEGLGEFFLVSEGDVMLKVRKIGDDVSILPMGNYCHIQELEDSVQTTTPGGIILPDKIIERPTRGKVLATGIGQRTLNGYYSPRVCPGDTIRYRKHSTLEVKFDDLGIRGSKTYVVGFGDVVCIETEGWKEMIQERLSKMDMTV